MPMNNSEIKTRPFGNTGEIVTCVGLGGEGVLRTTGKADAARAVIRTAIAENIAYYDCARVYADSERYYGSVWGDAPDARAGIFQASKSAGRDKKSALKDLDETLARMQIDHLDLWQIHDVRTHDDLARIAGPGGALEAFIAAKKAGKVKFIGVTGHHDPMILTQAITDWPVDAVMMPVNPVEAALGGFLTQTLPAATEKGIAVIGMKVLGAGHYINEKLGASAQLLVRFALAQGISVAIAGCATPYEVAALAEAGRIPEPLDRAGQDRLIEMFRPYAGRLAFYRGVIPSIVP